MDLSAIPQQAGIYRIVRVETGDEYVGSAVNLLRRAKHHVNRLTVNKHYAQHLQHAWNKYGEDAFAFEVLELVDDPATLLDTETCYLQARLPVYCRRLIATNNLGVRYGAETCALIKQNTTRQWQDPERKAQLRAKTLAQWADPVEREKKCAGMRGRSPSEETRAKLRAANLGKKASAEARAKMSAQRRGVPQGPHSAETRKRIGDAQRGKKRGSPSMETRAKLSAVHKGKRKSPEHVEKMRARMIGKRMSPEAIAKANASRAKRRLAQQSAYQPPLLFE